MPEFIPGLELSRRFYVEAVRPLLDEHFPDLPHAAARIGAGSEILGFDTVMSTDHHWGPTVQLFLPESELHWREKVDAVMRRHLPAKFYDYPVNFQEAVDDPGVMKMVEPTGDEINHRVEMFSLREFVLSEIAYDITTPFEIADWLSVASQKLRELTSGAVYFDGVGELTTLREKLAYYPPDVWHYLMAASWQRLAQEEHLMPRAGSVGDELGSALIGSRLVRDMMYLSFLQERQYAPYPKWFGTAFGKLRCSPQLYPFLWAAQQASTWQTREDALCNAYHFVAEAHNQLGITENVSSEIRWYWGRPFRVLMADRFTEAIGATITDPQVQALAKRGFIGGIDHISDSTDIRSHAQWRKALRGIYSEHI